MSQPTTTEQIIDLFLLRVTPPDRAADLPYYTTGSIMAAAVMRLTIIGAAAWGFSSAYSSSGWWWTTVMFVAWGVGVYPAYLQYRRFNESVEQLQDGTLCGTCRHFNPTNQLCTILDEHVTSAEPPCEGEAWEPR
ncbi:MAG: hypothetical protein J5I53_04570 [Bradyrhizobiaceae bacterium]|nr:hypothetical protein [Bradyrhizobiaceae bacterium]